MSVKSKSSKPIIHIVLIIGAISMLTPFIWMLLTSLKTLTEATKIPPVIFPKILQWSNYTEVMRL
ncbi:hypothetical protein CLVI_02510 [Clostridium vincentii]|uniref:L-arabinose transport system permease protein AraQ n=1 Tax=Clostridium vincentii TaxID=52704 RepID=A0A2T0BKB1_9CLOT|nr:hypothetical protein CLVI_02510 [Clostridium vincentii]